MLPVVLPVMRQHRHINGPAVLAMRKARGMSGRQLAARAYITPGFLHRIEAGSRQASEDTQRAIARALDVSPEAITYPAHPPQAATA